MKKQEIKSQDIDSSIVSVSMKYQVPAQGTCWILAEKLPEDEWSEIKGNF